MNNSQSEEKIIVVAKNGWRGVATPTFVPNDPQRRQYLVRFDNGQQVVVSSTAIVRQADGTYTLPVDFSELRTETDTAQVIEKDGRLVVPVIAEQVNVEKRQIQNGGIRVRKLVHEHQETVDEPLLHEEVHVERVAVNRVLESPVAARYEGETLIIPVLEETLVVEKRLLLKEELHITKRQLTTSEPQQVTLRTEEVVVEPLDSGNQPQA